MRLIRRIVLGLLAAICLFVGGLALTAYLLDIPALIETYKPQALAAGSTALNRDLEVGEVSPSWFPVLGVRASGLRIGNRALDGRGPSDAAGPETFVEVGRVEFGLAIWPALTSLGKDIQIASIRIDEPVVNVVRYADGSFNFSTLGAETSTPTESSGEGNVFLERLERAGVNLVALTEGTFRYDDRSPGGTGTLEVRRLGVRAEDIHLGDPVTAKLTAALKGALEPNLELSVTTTPLASEPAELGAPGLAEVSLVANGVPLSIVPVQVEGLALADSRLVAEVGARLDGEKVRVQGSMGLEGLRLTSAGSSPGSAFTVSSVLDLTTSTAFRQIDLGSTLIAIGQAQARAAGVVGLTPVSWKRVKLASEPFSVRELMAILPGERISVPDGNLRLDLETTGNVDAAQSRLSADWQGFEQVQEGLTARGDVILRATANGALARPAFTGSLDLSGLDVQGGSYAKPRGTTGSANVSGEVRKDGIRFTKILLELAEARFEGGGFYPLAGRGKVDFGATLSPLDVGAFLASLEIPAASVPAGSKLGFELRYQASPATPAAGRVDLTKLSFTHGKSDLRGSVAVESLTPLSLRLEGRSKRLDLDALLPTSEAAEAPSEPTDPNAPILPESMRDMRLRADLEVETLRYSGLDLTKMDVLLTLEKGQLRVKTTQFGILGGRFTADGTSFDLISSPPKYSLAANLERVAGSALLETMGVGFGKALEGRLDTQLSVDGTGLDVATLAKTLSGALFMSLTGGKLNGVDLVGSTVLPLRDALDFASASSDLNIGTKLGTEFDRLAGRFDVENGRLKLKEPLLLETEQGNFTFNGGAVGLDGLLNLTGTYAIPPSLLRSLTGGKVRTKKPLLLGFGLGCTMTKPCVKDVDVGPTAEALAKLYAGQALDAGAKLLQEKTGVDVGRARREAEAAKKKAEAQARQQLEAAKKKAENEARRQAEAAKRKAEEQARKAAEAAKKKAEEEAKKRLRGLFGN